MSRSLGSALGQMRHRVALEAPLETPDGAGGVTRFWQPVSTLWAAIEPIEGQSILVGDAPGITATHPELADGPRPAPEHATAPAPAVRQGVDTH